MIERLPRGKNEGKSLASFITEEIAFVHMRDIYQHQTKRRSYLATPTSNAASAS